MSKTISLTKIALVALIQISSVQFNSINSVL